jgi:hypothetical protein
MRRYLRLLASTAILVSTCALAADIEFTPPAGGGVAIKKSGSSDLLFRVSDEGKVIIPSLPSNLSGTPLCWDGATGVLQRCLTGQGVDTTPPTISLNAPATSTSSVTSFDVTVTDNVEIAYTRNTSPDSNGFETYVPEGTSQLSRTASIPTNINSGSIQGMFVAADTSGNIAKKSYTIATAQSALRPGTYRPIGQATFPADFDCLGDYSGSGHRPYGHLNGATLDYLETSVLGYFVAPPRDYSTEGYYGGVSAIAVGDGYGYRAVGSFGTGRLSVTFPSTIDGYPVTLTQTTIPFDSFSASGSGSGFPYLVRFAGELRVVSSSPPRIELDITMKCGSGSLGNETFVSGGQARFSGELSQ